MLSAMNDVNVQGAPVDWWFIYKLPHTVMETGKEGENNKGEYDGFSYLYFDPDAKNGLALSGNKLGKGSGALHNTLDHIFSAAEKPRSEVGWLLYNDEVPGKGKNNETRGHCKGILAFDKANDCGLWILHSTPRFPAKDDVNLPADEQIYAQTFIAITLENYETAQRIAGQLHAQQQPQVYAYKLPDSMSNSDGKDEIYQLCCGSDLAEDAGAALTSHIAFKSKAGAVFQSIAKNRKWGKDFWIDLVGPTLQADLNVESWRRGKIPGTSDSDGVDDVADVSGIDLTSVGVPVGWSYTHDHAKWATSADPAKEKAQGWVCVADINRQVSQEKRGGGSICFQQQELWRALSGIEVFAKNEAKK